MTQELVDQYQNEAKIAFENGDLVAAEKALCKLITLVPTSAIMHSNLGAIYTRLKEYNKAEWYCKKAIMLDKKCINAYVNLATLFHHQGRHDDALKYYDLGLEQSPQHPALHVYRAHLKLRHGKLQEGFDELEWRWAVSYNYGHKLPEEFSQKTRWLGEHTTQTVFIYAEGGIGDIIQFSRYIPMVAERVGHVIFAVWDSIAPLMKQLHPNVEVIPLTMIDEKIYVEKEFQFDSYCPILSLPSVFGVDINNLPPPFKFKAESNPLTEKIIKNNNLKIGFAWVGNPKSLLEAFRSTELDVWKPLFEIPGIDWYSLQVNPRNGNVSQFKNITDLSPYLNNWADTAAAIENLDLIISVDTGVIHLAGCMNKPGWVLVPFNSCWRWHGYGEDSPWYPSLTVLRQPKFDGWKELFEIVKKKLQNMPRG